MTQSPTRSQTFFNEDGVAGLTQRRRLAHNLGAGVFCAVDLVETCSFLFLTSA